MYNNVSYTFVDNTLYKSHHCGWKSKESTSTFPFIGMEMGGMVATGYHCHTWDYSTMVSPALNHRNDDSQCVCVLGVHGCLSVAFKAAQQSGKG